MSDLEPSRVVLIAEDEDNDFMLLERALTKQNGKLALFRARDGVEAINYLSGADGFADRRKFPLPDLVLLDLKMPRKGGFEVLEWMRGQPSSGSLIAIILSSSRQDCDVERAYRLGANSYLTKPNDYQGLTELMKALTNYWLHWSRFPEPDGARPSAADRTSIPVTSKDAGLQMLKGSLTSSS